MSSENKDPEYTTSDLFVAQLEAEGVEIIFGLPGEENADFVIALEKSKKIKFVLVRHEQGAAFMADVYGRLTQKPGVCFGTLGPGATNLVTGVADANMDRSPCIVITGQADTERMHKESHQAMDVIGLFKPLTKWGQTIFHASVLSEIVRKAFKIATTEKPGACHIELPEDVAGADAAGLKPLPPPEKVRRSVADDKAVDAIWTRIQNSKKPVILAGNGVIRHGASKQLTNFVQQTKIPVVNTFMGKGAISRQLDQCLFTVGLSSGDHNNLVIEDSDLVIAIGFDLVEYHPHLWNKKNLNIVHIDFAPAEVDKFYRTVAEAVGDLSHSLWMLNERVAKTPFKVDPSYYSKTRETMLKDFAFHKDDDTKGIVRPQKALWEAREHLGPDDILLSDVGAHKMWIARYYQCDSPNTCLISNGFCSMGFSLPGAIGAKLAFPERRVLAIMGDGGFLMNVQEMETAKRVGANIVVMVWVDNAYGLIAWKQSTRYGHHTPLSFGNPDFQLLAQSFGWKSFKVQDAKDVGPALEQAFTCGAPALVEVPIDYKENPLLTKRLGSLHRTE